MQYPVAFSLVFRPIPLDNADVKKLFSELTTIVHRVYLQFQ